MEEEDQEEEGERSTLRWFDVVLCAVATVVALLAVAALVGAVVVTVLRSHPPPLDIMIVHGAVLAQVPPSHPPSISLRFHLLGINQIINLGAVRLLDISIVITTVDSNDGNKSSMPSRFLLDDFEELLPGKMIDVISLQTSDDPPVDLGDYFVNKLYKSENITVTLRIEGTLATQPAAPLNGGSGRGLVQTNSNATVTYTCSDITLGVDNSLNDTGDDVSCTSY